MTQGILTEFASGWLTDSNLVALSIRNGDPVELSELIDLCAGARCLHSLATLACREFQRTRDCYRLWAETLETFQRALAAWEGIDGEPLIAAYKRQLQRTIILALDRKNLYEISQSDREAFVRRHRSDFGEERSVKPEALTGEEKRGEEFLSLPI